jgi:hypothetical protein
MEIWKYRHILNISFITICGAAKVGQAAGGLVKLKDADRKPRTICDQKDNTHE